MRCSGPALMRRQRDPHEERGAAERVGLDTTVVRGETSHLATPRGRGPRRSRSEVVRRFFDLAHLPFAACCSAESTIVRESAGLPVFPRRFADSLERAVPRTEGMTVVICADGAPANTVRDHGEDSRPAHTSRAHVLGLRQVLPRRRSAMRQRHREDDASARAVRRRLARVADPRARELNVDTVASTDGCRALFRGERQREATRQAGEFVHHRRTETSRRRNAKFEEARRDSAATANACTPSTEPLRLSLFSEGRWPSVAQRRSLGRR